MVLKAPELFAQGSQEFEEEEPPVVEQSATDTDLSSRIVTPPSIQLQRTGRPQEVSTPDQCSLSLEEQFPMILHGSRSPMPPPLPPRPRWKTSQPSQLPNTCSPDRPPNGPTWPELRARISWLKNKCMELVVQVAEMDRRRLSHVADWQRREGLQVRDEREAQDILTRFVGLQSKLANLVEAGNLPARPGRGTRRESRGFDDSDEPVICGSRIENWDGEEEREEGEERKMWEYRGFGARRYVLSLNLSTIEEEPAVFQDLYDWNMDSSY